MDIYFNNIASNRTLPAASVHQLKESGFVIIPGPTPAEGLPDISAAYDDAMDSGTGPDFKIASTTTRLYDLVNRGPAFDDVYVHLPLLEACRHVIGEPFKLSSLLARTLRPESPAQELHVDLQRNSPDSPMVGFILMIDPFKPDNGATRFVPMSQDWLEVPSDRLSNLRSSFPGEVLACGQAGSIIVFNGSIWHGHAANSTTKNRRSIQGYFVRGNAQSGLDFSDRMHPETLARISPLARYLLSI